MTRPFPYVSVPDHHRRGLHRGGKLTADNERRAGQRSAVPTWVGEGTSRDLAVSLDSVLRFGADWYHRTPFEPTLRRR